MVAFHRMPCAVLGASLLVLATCCRESSSAEPTKPPSSARLSDEQAQALALKVHADAALDRLPRFFYRIKSGNGVVDNMRDHEECSIEGLKEALDGTVADADWIQKDVTLAWTESHALLHQGAMEVGRPNKDDLAKGRRNDHVWSRELSFTRHAAPDRPVDFVYCRPDHNAHGAFTELAYFRVTPHHFWWATDINEHNETVSLVPPNEVEYRFVRTEPFDGELCYVVESPSRAEQLWIERLTGRLRGVLVSRYAGRGQEAPFYEHPRVEEIAGRRFATQKDYVEWLRGRTISPRQKIGIARAWCELHFDVFGPNELIRFRDYREVAPGLWMPFREDRAFTHPADQNSQHRKYIRLWVAVEEARADVDLTKRVESLRPKEGERIRDQRFGLVVSYDYKKDRTNQELMELVDAERKKQVEADIARAAQRGTEKLPGSPAPELTGEVWLNADQPPSLKKLRGKTVLLVLFDLKQPLFAPLVPPLLGFQETYGKQGLAVIGVHANGPRDEIEKRLADERITFPVLIDDGKTAERYGVRSSTCLLVDREGNVVSVYVGSLAPPAEIEKLLETKKDTD